MEEKKKVMLSFISLLNNIRYNFRTGYVMYYGITTDHRYRIVFYA